MSGHTATPWRNACFQVFGADNSRIAHTGMGQLPPSRSHESEANAAFIVTACNSHADLTEALKGATIAANVTGSLLKEKDAKIEALSGSHADLVKALEKIEYALRKDSLTDSERVHSAATLVTAALATLTARKVG